ncbi:MAG: GTPase HflX [Bacteroidota bacterium]|nr:GTPase HflX [Bacteroidota bacterium]
MQDIVSNKKELAILIGVKTSQISGRLVEEHLQELEMLTETAGAETVLKITQDRSRIDPAFFIGKGKAEEVAELVKLNDITLVIFDDDLNPTQLRNLEKLIDRKILDRSGLILDIFVSHAKTNQAKTQVELAQLQYMLPRLTRAWTHLSKQYGGIGTKGPGETQIETDRRIIRTRISKLKEKLKQIEKHDKTKSTKRKDFINATIVGYTNAGKSTLINLLTQSDVLAENKLFATLDSTTRSLELDKNKKMLISDTVGFIRKLPHHLVASFKSTLNVVSGADLILHVIDLSNPFFEDHIAVVDDTLNELGCKDKDKIMIFNKVDVLPEKEKINYVQNKFENSIVISAAKGMNIQKLNEMLIGYYEESFVEKTLRLPINKNKLVSQIYSLAEVISLEYEDDFINLNFKTSKLNHDKIMRLVNERKSNN